MRESVFTSELVASFNRQGGWAFKPSDAVMGSWNPEKPMFAPPKPCDILACYKELFIAIECKQIKKWQAVGPKMLRPSQIKNLDKISDSGGRAFVVINVRIGREVNRMYLFEYVSFSRLTKSIGKKELMGLKDFVTYNSDGIKKGFGPWDCNNFSGCDGVIFSDPDETVIMR